MVEEGAALVMVTMSTDSDEEVEETWAKEMLDLFRSLMSIFFKLL